jgi:membrane protein DedA with SNARE-associated domain
MKYEIEEAALISEITRWIMELMRTHGQLSVFIGVMIEQIIVPIPSPLIVMGAGAILILPGLSIPHGSYIGYIISFYGGKALVLRFQRFLDVDWDQIERLEKRFQGKKEALSIFLSRAIPVFPISLVSIFAGLLRVPIKPFTIFTFLGSIFRCFFLGFFGWWIGATYEKAATHLDSVETIVSIVMLIGMFVAFGYLYHKFRRKT